jgi:hypothetical protein
MSNGVIYYGAPVTSAQQTVSESLRRRGINLLKSTPRNATPDGVRLIVSPAYDTYIENLHVALESTTTSMAIPVNDGSRFKIYTPRRLTWKGLATCELFGTTPISSPPWITWP